MVIRSKIAGVTYKNADGLARQEIIRRACGAGMALKAIADPANPHDPNAIGLWLRGKTKDWQVGYLNASVAAEVSEYLRQGASVKVRILDVTGGDSGMNYGVNIQIEVDGIDDDPDDERDDSPRRRSRHKQTATIQQTGKAWKGLQALGCFGSLVAISGLMIASQLADREAGTFGAKCFLILLASLPVYFLGRVGAWWYHG